jgi:nucleotide-binding universal stress UspA family protein
VFKTIVLGLDGSDGANLAVPVAKELAKLDHSKLVIAHVEERIVGKGGASPVFADEDTIRKRVHDQVEELKADGIDASVETSVSVLGGPAKAIVEIADKVDADLIIVGTRGHAPLAGLVLGSVTQRLLHIAHRPVMAVPPAE